MPVKPSARRGLPRRVKRWHAWGAGIAAIPSLPTLWNYLLKFSEAHGIKEALDARIPAGFEVWHLVLLLVVAALVGVLLRLMSRADDVPRTVAFLQVTGRQLYRFIPEKNGKICRTSVEGEPTLGGAVGAQSDQTASVAISADGTLLANMAGQQLWFWEVDPATGETYQWGTPITFDSLDSPRVVAVSGKGYSDAWFALVTSVKEPGKAGPLYWGQRSTNATLNRVMSNGSGLASHAAYVGTSLLFDADTIVSLFAATDCCFSHLTGKKVTAVDTAQVGGRTYLAILTGANDGIVNDGAENRELIVLPADGGKPLHLRDVDGSAADVRIIRALDGTEQDVQVLIDMEPMPILPFVTPDAPATHRASFGARVRSRLGAFNAVPERQPVAPHE